MNNPYDPKTGLYLRVPAIPAPVLNSKVPPILQTANAAETVAPVVAAASPAVATGPAKAAVKTVEPIAPGFEGFAIIAARVARMGFLVHPVIPGQKYPLLKGWQALATSDLEQIAAWAQQYPQANAGAMASPNGHIFLDEDDVLRIRELYKQRTGEEFPRTYTTESRPGHRQSAWLQTDESRKLGNIVQGDMLDKVMSVRGKNEYVLVAGSIHPDTKLPYRVVDDSPIVAMPDKLSMFIQWLKSERRKQVAAEKAAKKAVMSSAPTSASAMSVGAAASPVDEEDDGHFEDDIYESDPPLLHGTRDYGEGERNDAVSRYAYRRWVQEMCSEDELREDAHEFNERHCTPRLSTKEVDAIIQGKLGLEQIGCGLILPWTKPYPAPTRSPEPPPTLKGDTVSEQMEERNEMLKKDPDAVVPPVNLSLLLTPTELAKKKPSWIDQFVQTASQISDEPVRWVLHELLLHEGVNILCAEHGSMKSILTLCMVKSILTNTPFAHRAPFGRPLRVVYLDAENPRAVVKSRLRAIGLLDADGNEIPGFKIWGGWISEENLSIAALMDEARLEEDARRNPTTFYVFDALSSFTAGADENANPEMAEHMRRAKRLARMSAGVLILHHTPKSGKAGWRGAMSIIDQSDHALTMERVPGSKGMVEIQDERFRACEPWKARWKVTFDTVYPDGRIGLYIRCRTVQSGVKGDQNPKDVDQDWVDAVKSDVDAELTDEEILTAAAAFIKTTREAGGDAPNQNQIAAAVGIQGGRDKNRLLCAAGRQKYWQCAAGPRGSILFYMPNEHVPTPGELEEAREEKKRKQATERKKRSREKSEAVAA